MPSFDIVSEVDTQEIDNALNQARKELVTRFDLKDAKTEIIPEQDKIILIADDGAHLKALREIVIGKLSKRGVDLRNVEQEEPAISSQAGPRREQSQRNYSGDQIPGVQSPKPVTGPANSRHRKKERRPANCHSIRA